MTGRNAVGGFIEGIRLAIYFTYLLYVQLPFVLALVAFHGVLERLNPRWAESAEPYLAASLEPFVELDKYNTEIPETREQ